MHDEYTMLMSLVLDQEAAPAEVRRLHQHLRTCPLCADTWQHWRALDRRLAASPMLAAPVGLVDRVIGRLDEAELRRRRARWLSTGLLAGGVTLTAVVAVLGGLAFAWLSVNMTSLIAWTSVVAQWFSVLLVLGRGAWTAASSLGAPTLAGAVGLLACATCALGMTWLVLVSRQRDLFKFAPALSAEGISLP